MDYQNREREINLKSMFYAVLYQWRRIILAALILAVLLGGYQGVQAWTDAADVNAISKKEAAYQTAMEEYEQTVNKLQLQIDNLQESIDYRQHYLDNSLLMTMDALELFSANATYFISTGYQILPDMTYQTPDNSGYVVSSYVDLLNDPALLQNVADEMGMEMLYLKELITISHADEHILRIKVRYDDMTGAQQIRDLLLAHLDDMQTRLSDSIGEHTITEVTRTVGPDMDLALAEQQEKEQQLLNDDVEALKAAQKEFDLLEEPAKVGVSRRGAVAAACKYGILGAAAGAVLVALAACIVFAFGDKVYSGEELSDRLNMKLIGTLAGGRRKSAVDDWLRKKEGRITVNSDENLRLIAMNIQCYCGDGKTLLLSGSAGKEATQKLAQGLQKELKTVRLVPGGCVLDSAEAMELSLDCDGVLLVEKAKVSRYSRVAQAQERISDMKKHLLGCIVIE